MAFPGGRSIAVWLFTYRLIDQQESPVGAKALAVGGVDGHRPKWSATNGLAAHGRQTDQRRRRRRDVGETASGRILMEISTHMMDCGLAAAEGAG